MGPRLLQSKIHSDYSTGSNTWTEYRNSIKSMYDASTSKVDFDNHLIREFNRKIDRLNQSTSLFISPYDGGFRFIGTSISTISPSIDADASAYIQALAAAGVTATPTQTSAIDSFIVSQKSANRWTKIKRLYFPIWQNAAANAICMKSLANGTFVGSFTHEPKGPVVPFGNFSYFNTNTTLSAISIDKTSYHIALLAPQGLDVGYSAPFEVDNFYLLFNDDQSSFYWRFQNDFNFTFQDGEQTPGKTRILTLGGNTTSRYTSAFGSQGLLLQRFGNFNTIQNEFPINSNILFLWSQNVPKGAFSVGEELTQSEDTAYAANLKTLWETCTSLTFTP